MNAQVIETALNNIAADEMGVEYSAALYESYAADNEAVEAGRKGTEWDYADAATRAVEDIEEAYYRAEAAKIEAAYEAEHGEQAYGWWV